MTLNFKFSSLTMLIIGCCMASPVFAQTSNSVLPPQVVTTDPSLMDPQDSADDDSSVTISPDDRTTSVRTYGSGPRPSRVVVDPPVLPAYSESPESEPQSVIPDSDPVRGDMVQPPMWTIWSW